MGLFLLDRCRLFVHVLPAQGDDDPAHRVAEDDDEDEDQGVHGEHSGTAEVEHVRDGVFRSREDEDRDADERTEVALLSLVDVGSDEHQDTAEDTLAEYPEEVHVDKLVVSHAGDDGRIEAGFRHHESHNQASDEVTEDDHDEVEKVGGFVVHQVSDLTGIEVESEGEHGEQSDAEQDGSDPFELGAHSGSTCYSEKYAASECDGHACENRSDETFDEMIAFHWIQKKDCGCVINDLPVGKMPGGFGV